MRFFLDCMEKDTNPKGLTNKERLNAYSFDNQLKEAQFAREPQREQQKFVREFLRQQAETSEFKLAEARKELQDCIADMKRGRAPKTRRRRKKNGMLLALIT